VKEKCAVKWPIIERVAYVYVRVCSRLQRSAAAGKPGIAHFCPSSLEIRGHGGITYRELGSVAVFHDFGLFPSEKVQTADQKLTAAVFQDFAIYYISIMDNVTL